MLSPEIEKHTIPEIGCSIPQHRKSVHFPDDEKLASEFDSMGAEAWCIGKD